MSLKEYKRKRKFSVTSEPAGKAVRAERQKRYALSFVIQKHDASHLHYDFRLEMEGVLRSWAVPKGPSLDPAQRSLAVEVEDHPLEYGGFEGTIPQGQYGGGTVMLWDRGTWSLTEGDDPAAAYRKGRLKFTLAGEKLRGGWTLIRMRKKEHESRQHWLLIKEKDKYARPASEFEVRVKRDRSVASARTMEQISKGNVVWQSDRPAKWETGKRIQSKRKRLSPTTLQEYSGSSAADLAGAKPGRVPKSFQAQLATLGDEIPPGDEWRHEIKFDGYRVLAHVRGDSVRLMTRNGNDWTERFPTIAEAVGRVPTSGGILDGEVVVLNETGHSDFQSLQQAMKTHAAKAIYYVFDVPYWDSFNLTECRLHDRQSCLHEILKRAKEPIRLSNYLPARGEEVLSHACKLGLEGIISKHIDSPYESARSRTWVKVKCESRQEFVIGGYTDPQRSRTGFGALLLGVYDDEGNLRYAGKVGTGFDTELLGSLAKKLAAEKSNVNPFVRVPTADRAGAHWINPKFVAEVQYTQWTAAARLRHPVFVSLREDKEPQQVRREIAKPAAIGRAKSGREREEPVMKAVSSKKKKPATKAIAPRDLARSQAFGGVTVSSPQRVVYPQEGYTKLRIAEYYAAVAEHILPHLESRPISIVRCPDGIQGEHFFQKHLEFKGLVGVRNIPTKEKDATGSCMVISGAAGLFSLVQMNTLELHTWGSRSDDLELPDRLVFDLDPGEGVSWKQLTTAARLIRDMLREIDLQTFVKTTGGKGLHVVVPLRRGSDWDNAKAFSHAMALQLVQREPAKYLAKMTKSGRKGRIFVDYLRNGFGATAVAAFSTRARPGAFVSMPVAWDDLDDIKPSDFSIKTAPALLARRPDPWIEYATVRQSLAKAAAKMLQGVRAAGRAT